MKKFFFILMLLISQFCAEAATTDSLLISKANEIISNVKNKYAPDKRTDIFNVEVQAGEPLKISIETTVPASITELRESLNKEHIQATINEKLLPDQELGNSFYGVANLSVCNNRLTPGNQAELVTQTLLGTPVIILKKERGYYLIRTPDRYISWVAASGITAMDKSACEKWNTAKKIVYIQEFGHSYSEPSEKSLPVSDLVHGVFLKLAGKEKGYYKVVYPDERIAYIPVKSALDYEKWTSRPNPNAEQILDIGKTLIGVPYLWGGTSIKGVDCSGFTKTCYYLNGIVIPRDASQQAYAGDDVEVSENDSVSIAKCLKNLKPGDLLFFGRRKTNAEPSVTHTGIYMGNGEFIHSSGFVHINSMVPGSKNYSDLVLKGLVKARRMLTSIGRSGVARVDQNPFYNSLSM